VAGANTNIESFSWLEGVNPSLGKHAPVEEGVA
jgi:hypothetical protein